MDFSDNKSHDHLKTCVHVEVCVLDSCSINTSEIQELVRKLLLVHPTLLQEGSIELDQSHILSSHVQSIEIVDLNTTVKEMGGIAPWEANLYIHTYKLEESGPIDETNDDESITTCQQTLLPAKHLNGLWESLVYDVHIKTNLLEYASAAMLFSDKGVNPNIISWNRVILLHGPPGTGKTSLCKALAQKLSIRLSSRFSHAHLLEINAHSLFSKWFSESGKLVMKLFQHIQELVDEEDAFVCVLIDEVESLTAARTAAINGSEPSDAIRVVNALLTQLDVLKNRPNVLLLSTSNLSQAIDVAFLDRADIKQYIGLPSSVVRYEILQSCLKELIRVGIIYPLDKNEGHEEDKLLRKAAELAEGFSGRALRKLPFQTQARQMQMQNYPSSLSLFLHGMIAVIHIEQENMRELSSLRN